MTTTMEIFLKTQLNLPVALHAPPTPPIICVSCRLCQINEMFATTWQNLAEAAMDKAADDIAAKAAIYSWNSCFTSEPAALQSFELDMAENSQRIEFPPKSAQLVSVLA